MRSICVVTEIAPPVVFILEPPTSLQEAAVQILPTFKNKTPPYSGGLFLVGTRGFEPPASCTPCKRSTRLNYVPLCFIIISWLSARNLRLLVLLSKLGLTAFAKFASGKVTITFAPFAFAHSLFNSYFLEIKKTFPRKLFLISTPCKRSPKLNYVPLCFFYITLHYKMQVKISFFLTFYV